MSYTFGAGNGDDINCPSSVNLGGDNTNGLVCGWFYPTTLTATRGYWSAGVTFGAEVDTTTSEIRMRTDNTTDGQWLTSGAGITTNKWWFIAWLAATENTTVNGAWRVWVGDNDVRPTEVTVTNPTVRSGNYTSNGTVYAGNKGTGTLAFQGDIGWISFLTTTVVGINTAFGIGTSGVISNGEAELTYNRWVLPLWMGRPDAMKFITATEAASFTVIHMNFENQMATRWSHGTTPSTALLTVNGATPSYNAPPTRPPVDWPNMYPLRRR